MKSLIHIRILFVFFLLGFCEIFAQSPVDSIKTRSRYIINAAAYNRGIYKTFEEFKYNSPSITDHFSFDGKQLWLMDKNGKQQEKLDDKEIWGFCDGFKIYVLRIKYHELLAMGRYCYFVEKGTSFLFPAISYSREIIISYNTGEAYVLSKAVIKTIFKTDDQELFTEFTNQKQKRKKRFEFLLKYNARNVSKIK